MKNMFTSLAFILTVTLMPGFGGCEKRCKPDDKQPPAPCSQPVESTVNRDQATPDDYYASEEVRHPLTRQFDRMTHNAELADMSITDIHFIPNRPLLNSNGTQRLNHLAWMVDQYGGSIMVDLAEPKSEVAQARLQNVIQYLKEWGLPDNKIVVSFGLPKSEGMKAEEAMTIYKDTRYRPDDKKTKKTWDYEDQGKN
jgi:hypothetical protein